MSKCHTCCLRNAGRGWGRDEKVLCFALEVSLGSEASGKGEEVPRQTNLERRFLPCPKM